jgi:hypothetical protein
VTRTAAAGPVLDHLRRLTDGRGVFEHALLDVPRPEHGYCVDDVARAVVVACGEQDAGLVQRHLGFVLAALADDGRCRNRLSADGTWSDAPGLGDWWGRALWALGVAAATAPAAGLRDDALRGFRRAAATRSPHPRALVFAGLGAGELLLARPGERAAEDLLRDAVTAVGAASGDPGWPWPLERLTYADAALPQVLLLAGQALGEVRATSDGLRLLDFLLRTSTRDGHLSVTPVGGRGRDDVGPGFDQQPIEVAAVADACARAWAATGDERWRDAVRTAWRWFLGDNDSGTPMYDPATGAGYDGLEPAGRNENRGAESTLAALSTAQHARRLGVLA